MRTFDAPHGLRLSLLAVGVALLGTGCPKNVDGGAHSGKDVKYKGAKKIKIEDNEGRSRKDIVTYPGGDRIDWKVFEIGAAPAEDDKKKDDKEAAPPPADLTGTLKITLRWKPPRPGLDLAFDVYDQYFHRIARAKPNESGSKRSKKVTIKDAGAGKYYVMVYAPRRTDAGTYRVQVKFQPGAAGEVAAAPTASDIPDPPTLPALPEAGAEVAGGTTGGAAPPPGPGTAGATTPPPPPTPPAPPPEVKGRVVKYVVAASGGLIITVDKGKNQGVEAGWRGSVLNASGKPLQGGDFQVTKVRGGESEGKVSLSVDQIAANKKVILSAPTQ